MGDEVRKTSDERTMCDVLERMGADPGSFAITPNAMTSAIDSLSSDPAMRQRLLAAGMANASVSPLLESVTEKAREIQKIKSCRDKFVLRAKVPALVKKQIETVLAGVEVEQDFTDGVGHSRCRVARDVYRYKVDKELEKHIPKNKQGITSKGAGDNRLYFIDKGNLSHHSCQGFHFGVSDAERKAEFLSQLSAREDYSDPNKQLLLQAARDEWHSGAKNPYACQNLIQDCDVNADVIRVIHGGDISPEDVALAMIKSNAKVAVGIMHYHPSVWITDAESGVMPFTQMIWQKRSVNGVPTITYTAIGDNQLSYSHNMRTQLAWFVGHKVISVYHRDQVRKFMVIHMESELDTLMWKMLPIEVTQEEILHSKLPMPSAEESVILRTPIYDPSRRKVYFGGHKTSVKDAMRAHVVVLPLKLYNDAVTFLFNTKNDFTVQNASRVFSNLIAKDRNPSNMEKLGELLPKDPGLLKVVAVHIYAATFHDRHIMSASTGEVISQQKDSLDIKGRSLLGKMYERVVHGKSDKITRINASGFTQINTEKKKHKRVLETALAACGLDVTKEYNALPETYVVGDVIPIDHKVTSSIVERMYKQCHVGVTKYTIPDTFDILPVKEKCDEIYEDIPCKGTNNYSCLIDSFANRINAMSGSNVTSNNVYNIIAASPLLKAYPKQTQEAILNNMLDKGNMPLDICALLAYEYDVCIKIHQSMYSHVYGDRTRTAIHIRMVSSTHVQPCRFKAEPFPIKMLTYCGETQRNDVTPDNYASYERFAKAAALNNTSIKGRYTYNRLEALVMDKALNSKDHKVVWDVGGKMNAHVAEAYNMSVHSGVKTEYESVLLAGCYKNDIAKDIVTLRDIKAHSGKKFDVVYYDSVRCDDLAITSDFPVYRNLVSDKGCIAMIVDLADDDAFVTLHKFLEDNSDFGFEIIRDCSISLLDTRIGLIISRGKNQKKLLIERAKYNEMIRRCVTLIKTEVTQDESPEGLKHRMSQLVTTLPIENAQQCSRKIVYSLKDLLSNEVALDIPEFKRDMKKRGRSSRIEGILRSLRIKKREYIAYSRSLDIAEKPTLDVFHEKDSTISEQVIIPPTAVSPDTPEQSGDPDDGGIVNFAKKIMTAAFDPTTDVSDTVSESSESDNSVVESPQKTKEIITRAEIAELRASNVPCQKELTSNSIPYNTEMGVGGRKEYASYIDRGVSQMIDKIQQICHLFTKSEAERAVHRQTGTIDFIEYGRDGTAIVGEKSTIRLEDVSAVYCLDEPKESERLMHIDSYAAMAKKGKGRGFAIAEFAPFLLLQYHKTFVSTPCVNGHRETKVAVIQAVAGAGKSYAVRKEFNLQNDFMVVHSRAARREMCEKFLKNTTHLWNRYITLRDGEKEALTKVAFPNIRTMAGTVLNKVLPAKTLYIDECFQFHRAEIDEAISAAQPTNVVLLGDAHQTKFVSHVKGIEVYAQKLNVKPTRTMVTSYRAPKSLEKPIAELYAKVGLKGYSTVSSIEGEKPVVYKYNSEQDIKDVVHSDIITFTSADKSYVNSVLKRYGKKPIAKTIAEYQGNESDNIVLFRIGNTASKSHGIYDNSEMQITALTRAKRSFKYITSADMDSLSMYIRKHNNNNK